MKTIEEAIKDNLLSAELMSDMRLKTIENAFTTGFCNGYDYANKWYSMADLPKKSSLIVLEYGGCSDSKNYTIYDYDTDYFRGKFHVNGIPTRWRYFL